MAAALNEEPPSRMLISYDSKKSGPFTHYLLSFNYAIKIPYMDTDDGFLSDVERMHESIREFGILNQTVGKS